MRQKDPKSTKGVAKFTLALKRGALLDDRYQIEELLAESSSFGLTYLATDTSAVEASRPSVAIKEFLPRIFVGRARDGRTVKPHSPTDATEFARSLRRFVHEGKILVDIASPSLVRVQRCLESNGTGYLIMDVDQGTPLTSALDDAGGRIAARDAVAFILRLLEPLERLHIEGVFHRAIAPASVTVTDSWAPTLHGFSARRHVRGQALELEPGFAAFEQYASNNVGPWTDVYGCAALLYHLITGEVPPTAIDRVAGKSLAPISAHVPDVAPSLSLAIAHGLSLLPEQRPHGIAEFRKQLGAASVERVNPQAASVVVGSALGAQHVMDLNEVEVDDPIALELAAGGRLVLPRDGEEVTPRFQRVFGKLAERARESVRSVMPEARVMDLQSMIPNAAPLETHDQVVDPAEVQKSDVVPFGVPGGELPPIHLEPELRRAPLVRVNQTEPFGEQGRGLVPAMDPLELQSRLSEMHRSDVRRKATRYVTASVLTMAVLGSAYGTLTYRRTPDVPRSRAATTATKPSPTPQTAAPSTVASPGVSATKNSSAQLQGALSDVEPPPAKGARNLPAPAVSDKKAGVSSVASNDSKSAEKKGPPATGRTPSTTASTPPATSPRPPTTLPIVTPKSVSEAPAAPSRWWARLFSKPASTRLGTTPKPAASVPAATKATTPLVTRPQSVAAHPVTVSSSAKTDKRTVPVDVLSDVEGRLASGNEEAEIGLYSLARRIYHDAIRVTDAALSKYSQADTLRAIRTNLNQADQRALRACQAENDSLRKSGRATIPCE
jgi:hypothetical protein